MTTRFHARLVSDERDQTTGQRVGLVGYRVTLHWGDFELKSGETTGAGRIEIGEYQRGGADRLLTLAVHDIAGRLIPIVGHSLDDPDMQLFEDGRAKFHDQDGDFPLTKGDLIVRAKDATGFLVTLRTGETPVTLAPGEDSLLGETKATGWGLSHGNAVKLLVDKDVYTHAAALLGGAQTSILLSQLTFSVPPQFHTDATLEDPQAIFEFRQPRADPAHPFRIQVNDARPERLLLAAAAQGADVRLVMHALKLPLALKIIIGLLLFPFIGSDGLFNLDSIFLDGAVTVDDVKRYFGTAGQARLKVQAFKQSLTNIGVMHARVAIVDQKQAMCIGGSFTPSYIDTHDHPIESPMRGSSESIPDHDAGIAVTGPAVGDLYANVQLLWNTDADSDVVADIVHNPPGVAAGADGVCSIQIVRTLTEDRFKDPLKKGEQGILEAYLRAIANATDFIYFENQYFLEEHIGNALVSVLKKRPKLQVIVLCNINPDTFCLLRYPKKQRKMITRIRKALGEDPRAPRQFGVFTRWTYEIGPARPRMLPVYIHSKVAIVDDKWATIGSANIDEASMENAVEVNANLLNGVDGEPESELPSLLRKKLWAEALGFSVSPSVPTLDPAAPELRDRPTDGWLTLWNQRAKATQTLLQTSPGSPLTQMASVLPWPPDDTTHKTPRRHLNALGIPTDARIRNAILPLKSTRAFDFKTGDFKPRSKAKLDLD